MNKEKSDQLKQAIARKVREFVSEYETRPEIFTKWGTPLVGFADAAHPYVLALKEIVRPSHCVPGDALEGASVIVVYYVPFNRELAKINAAAGRLAAPEWARAYEETNAMFPILNEHLGKFLGGLGYRAVMPQAARIFDREALMSDWSQRHLAYAAGLGTFGINNMLITKNGCCGRYNSVVTDLDVEPDAPLQEELCLYKKNGSCDVCIRKCPTGALKSTGFDRKACFALILENSTVHTGFGSSYQDGAGNPANKDGSQVCGKCITASPCAFWKIK